MAEPLKDKIIKDIDPSFDVKMFYLKDIKSAVEWLKEGLDVGIIGEEMYNRICATIDQAFPDIKEKD